MHEVSGLRSVSDLKRSTNRGKTYRPVYDPWVHKDRHSFTLRAGLNQPSLVVLVQTHRYILIIIQFCNDLRSTYISASAVEWRTDLSRNSSSPLNGLWLNFGFDKLISCVFKICLRQQNCVCWLQLSIQYCQTHEGDWNTAHSGLQYHTLSFFHSKTKYTCSPDQDLHDRSWWFSFCQQGLPEQKITVPWRSFK